MQRYHDEDWGVPLHDDQRLFEFLLLEGAQAGLSWQTILRKRDNYRHAFDGFDPHKVARYGKRKVESLLKDEGIVRNRLKVEGAVKNAKAFLAVQAEHGTFDAFIWPFVGGAPRQNRYRAMEDLPAQTDEAVAMSKALKKLGFTFVGPTICYAMMQATGMVNDHEIGCFRHGEVAKMATGRSRPRKGKGAAAERIAVKRVYEPAAAADGVRILVDRLWPRGLKKEAIEARWLRDVSPSTALRRWAHDGDDRYAGFCARYAAELEAEPAAAALEELLAETRRGKVTLLFAAKDEEHNNATALRTYLLQRLEAS
jgi:DNA-3-methyladenine glycosylase I